MAAAYRKVVDFNSLHLNYSIYLDILVYMLITNSSRHY